jgi:hypothetical protein
MADGLVTLLASWLNTFCFYVVETAEVKDKRRQKVTCLPHKNSVI